MSNLPKGETWEVLEETEGTHGVYATQNSTGHNQACKDCAREAAAGDPEAIDAILMCTEDHVLQDYVRKLSHE